MYEKFKNVTGYDIEAFFQSFVIFVTEQYPYIIDYYNGGKVEKEAFYQLDRISKEIGKIEPLFTLHSNTLNDIDSWELLDVFTEIETKIWTIRNSAKWLRSVFNYVRSNTIKVDRVLKTDENFEDVSEELGAENPQDDWLNITTPQYIEEEDYTPEDGSGIFSVNLQNIGLNYVDNIIDVLSGESILGIDIDKDFLFENDDLKIVAYDKAIEQALKLIQESLKGTYPEFENYGISDSFIGTTVNAIQYPSIFKDLMNMFQRDSRWKSVELLDVRRESDSIFLQIKVTAITENDYIINVPI